MKPFEDNPNKCTMTIINELDMKGSIPEFAMKIAAKEKGMEIDRLRKVFPEWKKVFPGDTP